LNIFSCVNAYFIDHISHSFLTRMNANPTLIWHSVKCLWHRTFVRSYGNWTFTNIFNGLCELAIKTLYNTVLHTPLRSVGHVCFLNNNRMWRVSFFFRLFSFSNTTWYCVSLKLTIDIMLLIFFKLILISIQFTKQTNCIIDTVVVIVSI